MNKKGFTLIELMAVIVILGVLAGAVIPVVTSVVKDAADKAYNANIDAIKTSAYDWALQNTRLLPKENNESVVVYLNELKRNTTIDTDIKNPKTGKVLSNNTSVTITKNNNNYTYTVNLVEIDKNEGDVPALIISGDIVDYVEVNQVGDEYVIPTAVAKDNSGNTINAVINHQIIKDGNEVIKVDESAIGVYKLVYSVTYEGKTGTYEKTVIVRDTTRPELEVGDNITCNVSTIPNDLLSGVIVSDNSGETITPVVDSKIEERQGTYYVIYTATDSSGNSITKRRTVVVE
jgi:type IV pilus assembly protein PilA